MSDTDTPLKIDIISDVMCPWCIVGYRQLHAALEDAGTNYVVEWHPFELNPNMPPEGQNLREHVAEKYGTTPEQSQEARKRFETLGDELGFKFDYKDDARMHNTFSAHQLLHWSAGFDRKHDLKQALFSAHFTHGRDLSNLDVLADIAGEIGLDRDEALAVLSDRRFANEVRKQQSFWTQQGISGVPAVVFDHKHLVTGAQGTENYTNILQQLEGMRS
jgi:predicted DsbA family dithiol-disulfide isomerase